MMMHPGVLALLLGSILIVAMVGFSAWHGLRIIRYWDIRSGSETQLDLERRTYLISLVMSYALGFQILSFILFIYTADALSPMFIGAMCAAGSLKVNSFGYPALIGSIITCLLSGLWLIVNSTDNKAPDYPLIRQKYRFLLLLAPVVLAQAILQGGYLLSLRPHVVTSCCALVFNAKPETILADLLYVTPLWAQTAFAFSAVITLALGLSVLLKNIGAKLFALTSLVHFFLSIVALISFISIYVYALPTHHCPFCLLHPEYHAIGYILYGSSLVSVIAGTGTGLIQRWRTISSVKSIIPSMQRKLALVATLTNGVFLATSGLIIWFSNLKV